MSNSRFGKVAVGVALLAMAGFTAALMAPGRTVKKPLSLPSAEASAGQSKGPSSEDKNLSYLSSAEFKALVTQVHPGMDLTEELEAMEEEQLDLTTLPLPERKERFGKALAAYNLESWDRGWAPAVEQGLNEEFKLVTTEAIFSVSNVECRTSTCLVNFSWQAEMAEDAYETILSTPLGLGCHLQMLPPAAGSREGQALLDCEKHREKSRQAVPMVATIQGPPLGP